MWIRSYFLRFVVSCNGSADKGVHLRGVKSTRPSEVVVKVEPLFLDDQNRPAQVPYFEMIFII